MAKKQQAKKNSAKAGRNKVKCAEYARSNRRFENKMRRIEACNGKEAAESYRKSFYARLMNASK